MAQHEYVPGVCNIGPEEIGRRRNLGWSALAVTLVLFVLLVWSGVNLWWRLLIFLPATMSASGFLQAHFQFCTGFARRGLFNFGPLGAALPVSDPASKLKDKIKGNKITIYAVIIGAVVAIVSLVL